jgi:MSHA pilin protein MshD
MCADRHRGFTLLELVVTLVILGVAFGAIAGLVATLGGGSASPVLQTQALYIAEGYLEEAMLKAYADPDPPPTAPEDCAIGRDRWDDVTDYGRCLDSEASPTDSTGVAIAALSRYRVRMTVGDPAIVGGATTRRVEVRVTHVDGDFDLRIAALKAQY